MRKMINNFYIVCPDLQSHSKLSRPVASAIHIRIMVANLMFFVDYGKSYRKCHRLECNAVVVKCRTFFSFVPTKHLERY